MAIGQPSEAKIFATLKNQYVAIEITVSEARGKLFKKIM
jgi:hypothetical protein